MANLHQGVAFSPQTTLSENIGAADTIIKVSDSSVFPDPPNYATIGTDELGETIEYAAKAEGLLSGCTRGVEGTAKAWQKGDVIARNFTAKDHNDMISAVTTAQQTANTAASAAEAAQSSANNAKSAADNAQSTANAAKATAEAALPKSGGTMTGEVFYDVSTCSRPFVTATSETSKKFYVGKSGSSYTFGIAGTDYYAPESVRASIGGVANPYFDTDAANKLYVDSSIVRQNLADNSYLLNPVNQRGKSSYTSGYCIDRWKVYQGTVSIDESGVTVNGANAFYQNVDLSVLSYLKGKQVTLSLLLDIVTPATGSFGLTANNKWLTSASFPITAGVSLLSTTFTIPENAQDLQIWTYNYSTGVYKPIAVKLEIGSFQTLVYQENGEWVLNEIPDYATELLKCQRYFVKTPSVQSPYSPIGFGSAYNENSITFMCPLPSTMRSSPSVTATGGFSITGNGQSFTFDASQANFSVGTATPSIVTLVTTNIPSTVTPTQLYILNTNSANTGSLMFGADL